MYRFGRFVRAVARIALIIGLIWFLVWVIGRWLGPIIEENVALASRDALVLDAESEASARNQKEEVATEEVVTEVKDNPDFYQELTDREVRELTGIDVARVSTESSTWTWRGYPEEATFVCPKDFICTMHLESDDIVVVQGDNSSYTIYAVTLRNVMGFEKMGEFIEPCLIFEKEYENGQLADPMFLVEYLQVAGAPECK